MGFWGPWPQRGSRGSALGLFCFLYPPTPNHVLSPCRMGERCAWAGSDPLYQAYHDEEWGGRGYDARALWEKLVLDGFQAGLAWITILRKREAFRLAYDGFDPGIVARYGEADVARLMGDAGIVRSR